MDIRDLRLFEAEKRPCYMLLGDLDKEIKLCSKCGEKRDDHVTESKMLMIDLLERLSLGFRCKKVIRDEIEFNGEKALEHERCDDCGLIKNEHPLTTDLGDREKLFDQILCIEITNTRQRYELFLAMSFGLLLTIPYFFSKDPLRSVFIITPIQVMADQMSMSLYGLIQRYQLPPRMYAVYRFYSSQRPWLILIPQIVLILYVYFYNSQQ